jgi:hypothetical protein
VDGVQLRFTESLFSTQPAGLFILMAEYEDARLTATQAVSMLSKMLNY